MWIKAGSLLILRIVLPARVTGSLLETGASLSPMRLDGNECLCSRSARYPAAIAFIPATLNNRLLSSRQRLLHLYRPTPKISVLFNNFQHQRGVNSFRERRRTIEAVIVWKANSGGGVEYSANHLQPDFQTAVLGMMESESLKWQPHFGIEARRLRPSQPPPEKNKESWCCMLAQKTAWTRGLPQRLSAPLSDGVSAFPWMETAFTKCSSS